MRGPNEVGARQAFDAAIRTETADVIKPKINHSVTTSGLEEGLNQRDKPHFQCQILDRLLTEGRVLPVAPLWTHFQHLMFPRPYADWLAYDQAMLKLYDCCLRLDATHIATGYRESNSSGADAEVETQLG